MDQERQLLLLMLLAQVCAWHDATPQTFCVHAMALASRGVLDHQLPTVQFLSHIFRTNNSNRPSLASVPSLLPRLSNQRQNDNHDDPVSADAVARFGTMLLGVSNTTRHTKNTSRSQQQPTTTTEDDLSWTSLVQEYPLSVSRYEREFVSLGLLASGSFGHVFHTRRILDGREYAVKRVVYSTNSHSSANQHPHITDDHNQFQAMLLREVQCLAVCDHPNVVRYYTSWLEPSWMTGSVDILAASNHNNNHPRIAAAAAKQDTSPFTGHQDSCTNSSSTSSKHRKGVGSSMDNVGHDERWNLMSNLQANLSTEDNDTVDPVSLENMSALQRNHKNKTRQSIVRARGASTGDINEDDSSDDSSSCSTDGSCDSWSSWGNGRLARNNQGVPELEHAGSKETTHRLPTCNVPPYNPTATTSHNNSVYRYQICLYIQMELCRSSTLADWIRARNNSMASPQSCTAPCNTLDEPPCSSDFLSHRWDTALEIFGQVVDGIHHVHETGGIVHRDLKPANIFWAAASSSAGTDLQFKIGDFGLSKILATHHNKEFGASTSEPKSTPRESSSMLLECDHARNINQTMDDSDNARIAGVNASRGDANSDTWADLHHTVGVGTVSYAAPEQVASQQYGTPVDIFSLGLILLELLCCFTTEHERLHTFQNVRHHRTMPPELDNFLEAARVILDCTESDACRRPSATELKSLVSNLKRSRRAAQHVSHGDTILALRQKLAEKDKQIEQFKRELERKDEIIKTLRGK